MKFSTDISIKVSVVLGSILLSACGGGGSSDGGQTTFTGTDSQRVVLEAIGSNVLIPSYQLMQTAANTLVGNVEAYCADLADDSVNLSALIVNNVKVDAQNQWRASMNQWQQVESYQFGPVADGGTNSIRNRIYSWPSVSSCFIDGGVVSFEKDSAGFSIDNQSPRRIGLDGLEYLLFSSSLDHTCSSNATTDSENGTAWNDRPDSERLLARCNYAKVLAADLVTQTTDLLADWQSGDNSYLNQLATAGKGSSRYSTVKDALNEITDAMFYLESEVKDNKLALPVGLSIDCAETSCPEQVESIWANNSIDNMKANLQGFLAILNGGIDDLLLDVGQEDITASMLVDINAALAQLDQFTGTLKDSVTNINSDDCINTTSDNRTEPACALYADIKQITDQLKSDFILALSLSVPSKVEGDND